MERKGNRGSSSFVDSLQIQLKFISNGSISIDVASKFGLIGPIAEQCEHKCVLTSIHDAHLV